MRLPCLSSGVARNVASRLERRILPQSDHFDCAKPCGKMMICDPGCECQCSIYFDTVELAAATGLQTTTFNATGCKCYPKQKGPC